MSRVSVPSGSQWMKPQLGSQLQGASRTPWVRMMLARIIWISFLLQGCSFMMLSPRPYPGRPASAPHTASSTRRCGGTAPHSHGTQTPSWSSDHAAGYTMTKPPQPTHTRSEEHTSELQSRENLVCRLLLE